MRSYLDSAVEKDGLERFSGVNLTNPGFPHQVHRPSGEKGKSVFRIYPYFENGEEKPLRLAPEDFRKNSNQTGGVTCDNAFYPWMTAEKMVTQMGLNNKFTVLVTVRGKDFRFKSPIELFVSTITSSLKNNPNAFPDWRTWTETKKGQRAVVPRIEVAGFVQCVLFENAGKAVKNSAGQNTALHPVIFILPKTARETLEKLCNLQNSDPNAKWAEEDFASRFVNNDLLSCANGKVLTTIYHPQDGVSLSNYTVEVGQAYPLDPRMVANEFKPWDQLLHYCDEEEQMTLLVQAFPPEAIDFVFGSSAWADLLPANIRGRFNQSRTVSGSSGFSYQTMPQVVTTGSQPSMPMAPPGYDVERQRQIEAAREQAMREAATVVSSSVLPPPPRVPGAVSSPAPMPGALTPPPMTRSNLPSIGVAPMAPLPTVSSALPPVSGTPFDGGRPISVPIGDPVVDQASQQGIRERLRAAQAEADAKLKR